MFNIIMCKEVKIRKPVPQKPGKAMENKKDKEKNKRVKYNSNQGELEDK